MAPRAPHALPPAVSVSVMALHLLNTCCHTCDRIQVEGSDGAVGLVSKHWLAAHGRNEPLEMTSLSKALAPGAGRGARRAQAEGIVIERWMTTPGFRRSRMQKAPSFQPAEQGQSLAP